MVSYSDLLRDPRWQRKRLGIMQRDGFACIACRATTKTLNVHHTRYVQGRMPWEYPDDELHTLCEDCHADEHGKGEKAARAAEAERARIRMEAWRSENPELAAMQDRLAEIDAEMPGASSERKDELTREKMRLAVELRRRVNRFRGYR